jgi:hypothetical protein
MISDFLPCSIGTSRKQTISKFGQMRRFLHGKGIKVTPPKHTVTRSAYRTGSITLSVGIATTSFTCPALRRVAATIRSLHGGLMRSQPLQVLSESGLFSHSGCRSATKRLKVFRGKKKIRGLFRIQWKLRIATRRPAETKNPAGEKCLFHERSSRLLSIIVCFFLQEDMTDTTFSLCRKSLNCDSMSYLRTKY